MLSAEQDWKERPVSAEALDLRSRYDRDGFVFPVKALETDEAQACRDALESAEAQANDSDERSLAQGYAHMLIPAITDLVRDPRVVEPVSEILGPDLLLWGANFFIKEARTGSFVSWHQDLNYWGLDGEDEVTAWVALSDASIESGAMRFIPGSHRDRVEHRDTFDEGNLLSRGQEIAEVDDSAAVDIVLKPGEMSLHHGLLFHASSPNQTDDRRIGLALRYIRPNMRQVAGPRDFAMLVSGNDGFGHFEPVPEPAKLLDPGCLASAREVRAAKEQFLFRGVDQQEAVATERRR